MDLLRAPGALDPRLDALATPAVVVDLAAVRHNIAQVRLLLGGDMDRWRPHVKTLKVPALMAELLEAGVRHLKCATPRELLALCELRAPDVLLAYPPVGPMVARVGQIARAHPGTRISVLGEDPLHVEAAAAAGADLFLDVDPGTGRSGIPAGDVARAAAVARAARERGVVLRGLHAYGGTFGRSGQALRAAAHAAYAEVLELAAALRADGHLLGEIVVAGTPGLASALDFAPLHTDAAVVRVSAGTVVLGDVRSLGEVAGVLDLRPAAMVLSRVISRPHPGRVTLDAGHKAVAADAGVPTCAVAGRPDWVPLEPSEEHGPVDVPGGEHVGLGTLVGLVPRHVCPTVNLHDDVVVVDGDRLWLEPVAARGHDAPLAAR